MSSNYVLQEIHQACLMKVQEKIQALIAITLK
jgi:hypothetical protein